MKKTNFNKPTNIPDFTIIKLIEKTRQIKFRTEKQV